MRLITILIASFLAGFFVESEFIKSIQYTGYQSNVDLLLFDIKIVPYDIYLLSTFSIYSVFAIFCFAIKPRKKSIRLVLSLMLICCMVISSFFSLLFIDYSMYDLLISIKQNNLVSWQNIYSAVELAALIIAGKDGLDFVSDNSRTIYNRFCDIICRNVNFN